MFIYEGKSVAVTKGKEFHIKEEMLAFVLPGVERHFRNTGSERLRLIWVFSPQQMEWEIKKKKYKKWINSKNAAR